MTEPEELKRMKEEFAVHAASGRSSRFEPSAALGEGFSRFIKKLELKRQSGVLTEDETDWLRDIDILKENIASFNKGALQPMADLAADERPEFLRADEISEEEASRIIHDFDTQFENKVLKTKKGMDRASAGKLPDFNPTVPAADKGVDLKGYLSSFPVEEPNLPFLDEDSHTDLATIKKKKTKD